MSKSESPIDKDSLKTSRPAIEELGGTLFMLAVVSDEDDAATLRADLKRSRLDEYKLQRCTTTNDARNMLRACAFDLLILQLDEFENAESEVERFRAVGFEKPILGLMSRRRLQRSDFIRPSGVDEVVCIDDLSPSLIESSIRSTIHRATLNSERALLESRLNLSMQTAQMGSWTYFPRRDRIVLDPIALALLKLPCSPAELPLDEIVERVFPEDQSTLSEALERFPLKNDLVECLVRVNGDQMPLRSLELKGRIWKGNAFEETSIIGVIREIPKANELYERITEANQAIQEALEAREDAFRKADQKLKALAEEFSSTKTDASDTEQKEVPQRPPSEETDTTGSEKDAPSLESEESKAATPDEVLSIDKKTAYQEVSKSVAKKKDSTPKQESLPFDFAQKPVAHYSPPNPAKEGFIGAAMRLVEMTRSENEIDATISIEDEHSVELEEKQDLLFEILKELLTNVARHSQAKICIVSLFRDEDEWVLQVEDDGVGLDEKLKSVNAPLNKIGLFQIRTQLALKGGHLDMVPASPNGLIARVRLPVSIRDASKNT
ncbi:MAG TPA: hypothetical protein DIV79_07695 [Opitutae bacterium]|nr:hypothetical protein [Opitutaceae bacterium]HCR29881.1 hypothetical protein [Opitutae bacterium]